MSRELQELTDRAALVDLVGRYAQTVDARDVDGIVACFTNDTHVEFDGGVEVVEGKEALRSFFDAALRRPMMGSTGVSTHLMSDVLVTLDGDRAHVETQAVAYLASDDRDTIVVRGLRYSDDCERRDGRWLVHHRIHRSVWQGEIPGHPTGNSS